MWLGKFLDLKADINEMASEIRKKILANLKGKHKLTPLEFTILEFIFNNKGHIATKFSNPISLFHSSEIQLTYP